MQIKKGFQPLNFQPVDEESMLYNSRQFLQDMSRRRTVRDYSDKDIPDEIIANAILAAGSAPSGAHMQPWHFVVIRSAEKKQKIREAAEAEEKELYSHRASDQWLQALGPLGTDEHKPFLETAPVLIAVFLKKFSFTESGEKMKNYYTSESVGIATGMLITALHKSGLATLTHTPSPMKFLTDILERPNHERPFLLLVCGYPAEGAVVPDLTRKSLDEIATFV
ncbi:MAG: iodotyrosine deiodinase [Parasphingorhabdus sp.]|jgi:iodotyrosine deiodinase